MTRFIAPSLSALGEMPALEDVSYDVIRQARSEYLVAALAAYGIDYDTTGLETDPLVIAFSEGGAYQEIKFRTRVNEAVKALSLATATGTDLDHIAATYAGIARLTYTNAAGDQPENSQWDDTNSQWVEDDDTFRNRILLAYEAFSTGGPEGAYRYFALQLDGTADVSDVAVYSEEDAATYSGSGVLYSDAYTNGLRGTAFSGRDSGDFVKAPEVLIVVVPTVSFGNATQSLLDRVFAATNANEVRPVGDTIRVEAAVKTTYDISVTLYYDPGADASTIQAQAVSALTKYASERRRVGLKIQREVIGGRAAVDNDCTIAITSPASDIDPGSKGFAEVGNITVTMVQQKGTWDSGS